MGDTGASVGNLYKFSQLYSCTVDFLITGQADALLSGENVRLSKLNAAMYDYSDDQIDFVVSLAVFLRDRVELKG